MWVALSGPGAAPDLPAGLAGLPPWAAILWAGCRAVGACLVVPAAEELAFRGYLARRLVATRFERVSPARLAWPPVLASSLLFGLLHQEWIAGCLAGLMFACLYIRRGRLGEAVLAHAIANAALLVWGVAVGDWRYWS